MAKILPGGGGALIAGAAVLAAWVALNFLGLCWSEMRFVSEREYIAAALSREWKSLAADASNRGLSQEPRTLQEFLESNSVYASLDRGLRLRSLFSGDLVPYTPPHMLRAVGIYRVVVLMAVETNQPGRKYRWRAITLNSCCYGGKTTGETMDSLPPGWKRITIAWLRE